MPKDVYDENAVECPVMDYVKFMALLELLHDLRNGTPAMRAKGKEYLPQEEGEEPDAYKARLGRSYLLNYFDQTVERLSGEVFSKPIQLPDNMAEDINVWSGDIDLSGNNITRFAKNLFEAGITDGVVHILVDMPQIQTRKDEESGMVLYLRSETADSQAGTEQQVWVPLTIEAMRDNDWRPYFVQIEAEQLIGWRTEKVNGKNNLTQVRIMEVTEEPYGQFGTQEVKRIRVLQPGSYTVYQYYESKDSSKEGEWLIREDLSGKTNWDYIPLLTYFIGKPYSQMTCKPPLDDLGHLNLAHWQSSSDQRNILHYARLITYFGKLLNIPEGETNPHQKAVIGANVLLHSNQPEADLKVVEHSGQAIEAGRNDLKDLEAQMAKFGYSIMLGHKPGAVTATEKALDTAETDFSLMAWAQQLENVLNDALTMASTMMNMEPTAIGDGLRVNTDFRSFLQSMEVRELREAWNDGLLPREIVIDELKRRGVIKDDIDFAELVQMIDNEQQI